MPTVVIAYNEFQDTQIEEQILDAVDATVIRISNLDSAEAQQITQTADAVMVTIQPVTAQLIQEMTHCQIISRVGTGLDAIAIPAATAQGIWVTNVPDYSTDEVSTHVIALLLAQVRHLLLMIKSVRQGTWFDAEAIGSVTRLNDQILGVIGFGRIGQATAKKALGIGLKVIACDPFIQDSVFHETGVQATDMDTLLRTSDYISLHMPLTDSTHHIINAEALSRMKSTAYLLNAARGSLIDNEALLEAVRSEKIAGAALDVLAIEPPPSDHPLLHEERIVITPHGGWYSEQAKQEVRIKGAEEVLRVLKGETPRSPVNQPNTRST